MNFATTPTTRPNTIHSRMSITRSFHRCLSLPSSATARLLISGTYGYDNSTPAAMPFYLAKGAKEADIDVGIVLALDYRIPAYVCGG